MIKSDRLGLYCKVYIMHVVTNNDMSGLIVADVKTTNIVAKTKSSGLNVKYVIDLNVTKFNYKVLINYITELLH